MDGISIHGVLLEQQPLPQRDLFWRLGDSRAVRSGSWKLVSIHDRPFELYDLSIDVAERSNQAATRPQKLSELRDQLVSWEGAIAE
jgi:hypothetical protein